MDSDFVWLNMIEEDMMVGLRPSQVSCLITREKPSMILGEASTHRVDIYLIGEVDQKAGISVKGTAAEIATLLGLPIPGAENGVQ